MIEISYYNSDTDSYESYEVESIPQLLDHLDNAHELMWIEEVGNLLSPRDVAIIKDLSHMLRKLTGG